MVYKKAFFICLTCLLVLSIIVVIMTQIIYVSKGEVHGLLQTSIRVSLFSFTMIFTTSMIERMRSRKDWHRFVIFISYAFLIIIFTISIISLPVLVSEGVSVNLALAISSTIYTINIIALLGGTFLINKYYPKEVIARRFI